MTKPFDPFNQCTEYANQIQELLAANAALEAEVTRLRNALETFIAAHEECEDSDGFTAQIVSMDDYYQAQEAIASVKGIEMKEYNEQVVETLDDAGCIIANKNIIIDNLQARIAELEEENARMNLLFVKAAKGKGENLKECFSLQHQLAASQEEMNEWRNQAHQSQSAFDRLQDQLAKAEQRVAEAFIECMVDLKQRDYAFTGSTVIGIEKCETAIRSGEYRKFVKKV